MVRLAKPLRKTGSFGTMSMFDVDTRTIEDGALVDDWKRNNGDA